MNAKDTLEVRKLLHGFQVRYASKKVKTMVLKIHRYACMNIAWEDTETGTCCVNDQIYTCGICPFAGNCNGGKGRSIS